MATNRDSDVIRVQIGIGPIWSTIPTQELTVDDNLTFELQDFITSSGGDITVSIRDTDLPSVNVIHIPGSGDFGQSITLLWTIPDDLVVGQTYTLPLTATDDNGSSDYDFLVEIQGLPPEWTSIPTQEITINESINFDLNDYVDGDGTIEITATNVPTGFSFSDAGVLTGMSATETSFTIDLTATSEWGSTDACFTVSVDDDVPVWSSIPRQDIDVNESLSLDLSDYVTSDTAITYSAEDLPSGFSIDETTGVISGSRSNAARNVTVTVTATNVAGDSHAMFVLDVDTVMATNPFSLGHTQSFEAGEFYEFDICPPSGGRITSITTPFANSVSGQVDDCVTNNGSLNFNAGQTFTISISGFDSNNNSISGSWTFTVQ